MKTVNKKRKYTLNKSKVLTVKEQLELYKIEDNFAKIKCNPFIKWPGGKRQLLSALKNKLPIKYSRYFEPFVGGGALFFYLKPSNGYISDANPELINAYNVIRNQVEELIQSLKKHRNNKIYYNKLRSADRTEEFNYWNNVERASRMIFLNKTCYNGLYRVNSSGKFNVPFGSYKNPRILDEENLIACSALLKRNKIVLADFRKIQSLVSRDDFVYFDPPYVPISKTSSFTKYHKDDFGFDSQLDLKELCDALDKKGVLFMLSNSYEEKVKELYKGYKIEVVRANRAINCKADGRGKINELIVTNY